MTLSSIPSSPIPPTSTHHLYHLSLQASLQLQQTPTPANIQLQADLRVLKDRLTPGYPLTPPERDLLRRSLLSTLALAEAGQFTAATPRQLNAALANLTQSASIQA